MMSSHTFVEASAQLLCATPTAHWIEVLDAAGGLRQAPLRLKDGMLILWDTPGIGLDRSRVHRYAGADEVVANLQKFDAQVTHGGVDAVGVEQFD